MRTAKKKLISQRQLLDDKLAKLRSLLDDVPPRSGWLKAIRTSLGVTTRQLGARMGTTHQVVLRLQERETKGAVALASLDRAARAMNCRLVYAIVPEPELGSLEAILDQRAMAVARELATSVSHSMTLEQQGVSASNTEAQIRRLAQELKRQLDHRLWDK